MGARSGALVLVVAAALSHGCHACAEDRPEPEVPEAEAPGFTGDVARGKELVARFECNRCHDGTGLAAAPRDKHCVHCHQAIDRGDMDAPEDTLEKWQSHIVSLRHAPSLEALGARLRPGWVADYLEAPHDLRPSLPATMPRLAIDGTDARDLAAYLASRDRARPDVAIAPTKESLASGGALLHAKGCGTCHAFTGAPTLVASPLPVAMTAEALARGRALAPDLRHTRARFLPGALTPWLQRPSAVKPDTAMPDIPLTEGEARDMAAYILRVPLADVEPPPAPARLPLLTRPVPFAEVESRVFRKVCWHCHADADFAFGDGGPGSTGGFGFPPRGIDLSDYTSIASGYVDASGQRRSLFQKGKDGTPRLVAALLARHAEVRGAPDPDVRGMPLGLPPLPPTDIQLVASWIAQGRPQ